MTDRLTDTQIRAGVQSLMARHGIDMNKTSVICARGVVRMMGELRRQGSVEGERPVEPSQVEAFEHDLHSMRGVVRVFFDFANWRRIGLGQWEPIRRVFRSRLKR